MRMLCERCGVWMEVKRNGITVRPKGYRGLFRADLWHCKECGTKVIAGFGQEIITDEIADWDWEV